MTSQSGIYQIINKINGHRYIGSAVNVAARSRAHKHLLKNDKHDNIHLQRAWNKWGEAAIEFRVIGTCTRQNLVRLEQECIDHLKPEYNISPVAGSRLGLKHTSETKAKMSKALMGNTRRRGQTASQETKQKMSMARKGRKCTPETKAKISKARMGRPVSLETRTKISKSLMGRKLSPEHKSKVSKGLKRYYGKHHT